MFHQWLTRRVAVPVCVLAAGSAAWAEGLAFKVMPSKHPGEIYEIEVTADSRLAITTAVSPEDTSVSSVKVWEVASGNVIYEKSDVRDVAPVAVMSGLAVRSDEADGGGRRIVLLPGGQTLARLSAHESLLAIVRAGDRLEVVSLRAQRTDEKLTSVAVSVHDGSTGSIRTSITLPEAAGSRDVNCPGISSDGRWLACTRTGRALLVGLASGDVKGVSLRPRDDAPAVAVSADGASLLTFSARELVRWAIPSLDVVKRTSIRFLDGSPRWSRLRELVPGKVVRLDGTRAVAFADIETGTQFWAARGSSINRFRLEEIDGHHFLHAFRSRSNPTTWRVIRHGKGAFKELYEVEERVALGSLVTSRNGKCLTLLKQDGELSVVDPLTRREHGRAVGLPDGLYRGEITPDGQTFIVTGVDGKMLTVDLPAVCRQ